VKTNQFLQDPTTWTNGAYYVGDGGIAQSDKQSSIPEGLKKMAASTEYKPYKRVFTQMILCCNILLYLEQLGEATLI
jgi:hypothetical protein